MINTALSREPKLKLPSLSNRTIQAKTAERQKEKPRQKERTKREREREFLLKVYGIKHGKCFNTNKSQSGLINHARPWNRNVGAANRKKPTNKQNKQFSSYNHEYIHISLSLSLFFCFVVFKTHNRISIESRKERKRENTLMEPNKTTLTQTLVGGGGEGKKTLIVFK